MIFEYFPRTFREIRLTLLQGCPFFPFNPDVVIGGAGLSKDEPGELGSALGVEVGELDLGWHSGRVFVPVVSDEKSVEK